MTPAAAAPRLLRLLLLLLLLALALQLTCVGSLALPTDGPQDSPRRPAAGPHRKAPQFMLDLFDEVSGSGGPPKSQKEILDGNTVRSFEDKGRAGERFHFFNLSSFGRDELMIKAEFRWFRKKQDVSHASHFYKVDLYEVIDSQVKPWRGNLIASRLVPLYTQGWEVFNVTQMVSRWIQNSQENNGILAVTTLPPGYMLAYARSSPKQSREPVQTDSYLVIFSDDGRTGASNQSYLGQAEPTTAAAPELRDHRIQRRHAPSASSPRGHAKSCQRVPLFVDFEEIGWSGWIISPRGYNAYHCQGSCPFPLGESLRATNHATVRSIMHALRLFSDQVRAPCCVPDRLQSISLLYFDEEENVVLKQYDDMVALSCGCH